MTEKRFVVDYEVGVLDTKTNEIICDTVNAEKVVDLLNEQQEQLDLYKEAILTMLGVLADKGIIFSGVKDE